MFPNPQDALPLPQRSNREQYRKLAKELARAAKSGEGEIRDWSNRWITALVRQSGIFVTPGMPVRIEGWKKRVAKYAASELIHKHTPTLTKAQFVIARSHGFESWPKFLGHLQKLAETSSATSQFEVAADAIVNGDLPELKRLLRDDPTLVRMRSTREHGATLLHYVSANGVEGYRQKTPKNIVMIASMLLDAGAEVDATCYVYGSDCTTLGLTATSVHPARAGVMNELLQLLLDHGASMETTGSAGRGHTLIFACLANGRPEAAQFLAAKGAPLDYVSAAALDQLEVVKEKFNPDGTRKLDLSAELAQEAFRYACGYGANRVVKFLLEHGADLAEHSGDGQTGTHYTVIFGRPETLKILLRHNPPLEATNMYGGTVLGQALWSAAHGGDPEVYGQILEMLIAVGAKLPEKHPPVNPKIDALLAQRGSRVDTEARWFEEE